MNKAHSVRRDVWNVGPAGLQLEIELDHSGFTLISEPHKARIPFSIGEARDLLKLLKRELEEEPEKTDPFPEPKLETTEETVAPPAGEGPHPAEEEKKGFFAKKPKGK